MTTWRLLFLQDTRTQQLQVPFNRIQQAFDLIGFMRGICYPGEIIQAEIKGAAAQAMVRQCRCGTRMGGKPGAGFGHGNTQT